MTKNTPVVPDDAARAIMLAFGAMDHGGPYWCYVAVKPSRLDEFKALMDSKQYNMQGFEQDGFGEVLVSGEGSVPPAEITLQLAQVFHLPVEELFAVVDMKKELDNKIQKVNDES